MNVAVTGLGIWSRGLYSYADLVNAVRQDQLDADAEFIAPKPEAISARERRRAGLMINLAVMVAHQACAHASVDSALVPSVFVSSMGDTDITDYMCRKLAQPDKLLSPTRFHNSVHNAPAGYWSISAGNRAPSTFVGGYEHSFGAGLLEAISQAQAAAEPVLLVAYDIANKAPFAEVTPISEHYGCALIIAPAGRRQPGSGIDVDLQVALVAAAEPAAQESTVRVVPALAELAHANPSAVGLTLLQEIVRVQHGDLDASRIIVPAARSLNLDISLRASDSA